MKSITNLSIAARVGSLSAITVVAIVLLFFVARHSQELVSTENDRLAEYSQMDYYVSQVLAKAQDMRRLEKDFLLTKDETLQATYAERYGEAVEFLKLTAEKPEAADQMPVIESLETTLAQHKSDFDAIVVQSTEMGLNEKVGLKGELRGAVHNVEEKLKAANLDALTVKMLMMRRHEKDFMLRGDDKYIGRIDDRRSEFAEMLPNSGLPDAEQKEISALLDTYQAAFKKFAEKARFIDAQVAAADETFAKIMPDWSKLSEAAYLGKQAASAGLESARSFSNNLFLVIGSISLILAIGLGWLIGRSITRPINDLTGVMNELAGGNNDVTVAYADRGNEIGSIARAVEVFRANAIRTLELEQEQQDRTARAEEEKRALMENLASQFEASVGSIVERVSSTAANLDQSAQTMARVSENTSERAEVAASASAQTTENVSVVASAAEEMTASISEINEQIIRASAASKSAAQDVTGTATQMETLANMADRIGEVVSMISDIAEQTNLLALNATIESARAGEAGKGFAVVASEVKALANETAKATENISELVTEIQAETKTAVGSIAKIGDVMRDLEQSSTAIASAMEEQGATTQSVAENVAQAANGTRDVSDSIKVVKDASVESSDATHAVQSSINDLTEQSNLLRDEVNRFLGQIRAA
ncbi:HAMP domain-containing protein [Labrenzia sp. R4_2]|uniref:methyl-accepting chemotaxis protein n=1 Tax=Labrenzia sp. R4_2 TaxID=2821107 RepID=UPI001ADBD412|nr:methyl-accepting chemotaxis protein [Labrenzia sp. R4_2]MBO9421538.1 HAMP domain-containing protein [Labrenzia sp. R4_2]